MNRVPNSKRSSMVFMKTGLRTDAGLRVKSSKPPVGVKRGKIKGWSYASRRRMREWMLDHQAADGWTMYGLTVTIPGPEISLSEASKMWAHFSRNHIQPAGFGMVWRLEIQKRKQPHWHALVCAPDADSLKRIKHMAEDSIDWLGPLDGVQIIEGKNSTTTTTINSRMGWPGAGAHAVRVEVDGGDGRWLRYLQDHASKRKQDQVAECGRQWGVVGRVHFVKAKPLARYDCTDEEFTKVMRFMRKLFRPCIKTEGVWGWKHGYKSRRGSRGRSVWFTEETKRQAVMRYLDFLRSTLPVSKAVGMVEKVFLGSGRS
jgi:hypothetical protein